MVLPLAFTSLSVMGISPAAKSAEPTVICLIPSPEPRGKYLTCTCGLRAVYASPHAPYNGAGIEEPQPTSGTDCCAGRTNVRETTSNQTSRELPIECFFTGEISLSLNPGFLPGP